MSSKDIPLDVKSAEDHLLKFLAVEGVTGQEAAIAAAVIDELKKVQSALEELVKVEQNQREDRLRRVHRRLPVRPAAVRRDPCQQFRTVPADGGAG